MDNQGRPSFDLPRYLKTLPLFSDLSPQELVRMAEGCVLRRFSRGQTIFMSGQPCNEFHVCVLGQVKLDALSPGGQEKVIEIIGPGGTFAEALMFTDRPYIVNAHAVTDAMVLSVGKQAVVAEIARDPKFSMRMLAGISRRMHSLVRDVQDYTLCNGAQRIIGYLLRDVDGAGDQPGPVTVSLPVSKATIASRLSLTPEYFSRVLHELESEGLIEIDKRDIRITDPRKLADFQPA